MPGIELLKAASPAANSARHCSRRTILKAGCAYFASVFAVGFLLGPIRELWAIPKVGQIRALTVEGVLMLGVSVFFARYILQRFGIPRHWPARFAVGMVAFGMLQGAEMILSWWLHRQNPVEYLSAFRSIPGAITLFAQLAFGIIPLLGSR